MGELSLYYDVDIDGNVGLLILREHLFTFAWFSGLCVKCQPIFMLVI